MILSYPYLFMTSDALPIPSDPAELNKRLNELHAALLATHDVLLKHERARYERERGPVGTPMEFLTLLINDPFFAWMRQISGLLARIDEYASPRRPQPVSAGQALLAEARTILSPSETGDEFQRQYHRALNESAEVSAAHGQWKRIASLSK